MFSKGLSVSRGSHSSSLMAKAAIAGAALAILGMTASAALANTITILNPSFEDNTTPSPGYGAINDWSSTDTSLTGVNVEGGPFADNGAIPNGLQVAFVQANNGAAEGISQSLTGFVTGQTYDLSFYYNARYATFPVARDPLMAVTLGSSTLTPSGGVSVVPASASYSHTVPYYFAQYSYTATGSTATLTFSNINIGAISTGVYPDSTLLLDDVSLQAVPEPASLGLLAVGGLGLLLLKRRKEDGLRPRFDTGRGRRASRC